MQIELLEIDFNSEEAIYMQLRNQIILGIATSRLQDGDTLPSVRQMAECIGINTLPLLPVPALLQNQPPQIPETAVFLSASYRSVPEKTQNYNKDRSSFEYLDQIPVRPRNWGI